MPYRFWLFAALSALFIVTAVYYLPLRFRHQAGMPHGQPHAGKEVSPPGNHGAAAYHEEEDVKEGLAVHMQAAPEALTAGTVAILDFLVHQMPGMVPVAASRLEVEHEKLMHVIGVRDDLNEFFHIHPAHQITDDIHYAVTGERLIELPEGMFTIRHAFRSPGRYKLWSQVAKDGTTHTFGHREIVVAGEGESPRKTVSFGRNAIVEHSAQDGTREFFQVAFELSEPVVKGEEIDLSFDVHTASGQEVAVEPYLGAAMHLVVIKDDLKRFIHAHPEAPGGSDNHHGAIPAIPEVYAHGSGEDRAESGAVDETVDFHVTFPEAGLYKAFAQFRPGGIDLPPDEALTAGFWIQVKERTPLELSRGLLTAISLALIALLSFGVRRFLRAKQ